MSFPVDLDEIPTKVLQYELVRREDCYKNNTCHYCGAGLKSPNPCKMKSVHNGEDFEPKSRYKICDIEVRPATDSGERPDSSDQKAD